MKTIDAKNQSLGRIASQAAKMLMGKDEPSYQPNVAPTFKVQITNASKLNISEKKKSEKVYTSYSGYHSGLKKRTMSQVLTKKGHQEIIKKAIKGMLPANKLRAIMLKNLTIID